MGGNASAADSFGREGSGWRPDHRRQIGIWLLVICAAVFGITVLGGVTRLTGSGLSMVDWQPLLGVVPPLSEAQWLRLFEMYRQSPEYIHINTGMSLGDFKTIFWFEYGHRMVGRMIGLLFLLPFLYFLIRRRIPLQLIPKLLAMFVLGGLQGVMGWYMVMSGLAEDPFVSPYRLTAHFSLAMVIYVFVLWVALDLLSPRAQEVSPALTRYWWLTFGAIVLVVATMVSGAFVAGLKAGYAYNTFPTMAGHWIPDGYWYLDPAWRNLFENLASVQFNHRVLALLTTAAVIALWIAGALRHTERFNNVTRTTLHLAPLAILLQATLGVATLLLFVPTPLAAAHQGGAVVVLTVLIVVLHQMRLPARGPAAAPLSAKELAARLAS